MKMQEDFVNYVWMHRLAGNRFRSLEGEEIKVEHPGVINRNAGPDFLNARIRIGDTLWAGNVEIHWKASDWYRHGHDHDMKYAGVILHVVMDYDKPVYTHAGRCIPSLDLSEYIPEEVSLRYSELNQSQDQVPCYPFLAHLNWPPLLPWLGRLALERLERKANEFILSMDGKEDALYNVAIEKLFPVFGLPANKENFERLHRKFLQVPGYSKLASREVEACLLYLSGMSDDLEAWAKESVLKPAGRLCNGIQPLNPEEWSFLRMRPHSFPSVRIALLSATLPSIPHRLDEALLELDIKNLDQWFNTRASNYWDTHFSPGKKTQRSFPKSIGGQFRTSIIANWLAPLLTAMGILSGEHDLVRKAFACLEMARAEDNWITRKWDELKLEKISGTESQGLIELHQEYCSKKRCLECRIGYIVLKGN